MGSTEELIEALAGGLAPVRRLRPPAMRAAAGIALGTLVVAALVLLRGTRHDLADRLREPAWWVQVASAWLAGATATLACFEAALADRSRLWLLLPLPALALWFAGFGWGCLGDWVAIPAGADIDGQTESCLVTLVGASLPLGLAIWVALRRTRPLHGAQAAWLAGIAVAGYADTAHLLVNTVDPSALVLTINILPSTLIAIAVWAAGRRTGAALG